jgi:hypothetical protein
MDCRLLFIGIVYTAVVNASDDWTVALRASAAELPTISDEKSFFAKQPEEVISHLSEQERSVNLMTAIESWPPIRLSGDNAHKIWLESSSPENLKVKCIESAQAVRKLYDAISVHKQKLRSARDQKLHDDIIARREASLAKAEKIFREKATLMRSCYDEYMKTTIKQ